MVWKLHVHVHYQCNTICLHQILLHQIWMNVQQIVAMVHVIRLASIHLDHTNVTASVALLLQGIHVMVSAAFNDESF